MSIDAMKQALEALALFASDESDDGQMGISAYETLRQAIAEAQKQEPACWINGKELAGMRAAATHWDANEWKTNLGLKPMPDDVPLYTAPVMSEKHVQVSDKNRHKENT
jgi:hypothetical protein